MPERVKTDMGGATAALDYRCGADAPGEGRRRGELCARYWRSIVRPLFISLYRMVQNHAVAEELAQEVFLRVYRSRGTYEPTAKFTTWLFRIATHLALELAARRQE